MTMFLIGCDPEVFVKEKKTGKLVTAHGLVKGTKHEPFKVPNGAYQVDGMALEFNIDPVVSTDFNAFNNNIISVMKTMKEAVPDHRFVIEPSVQFDPEYYENAVPNDAKELGCEPDWNAYTGKKNPRPDGSSGLRSAAGHIHVGWGSDIPVGNEQHISICRDFVKQLDCYVGLGMLFIDADKRRRELYGKAGAYRVKPYGVEYRTPSNAWLTSKSRRKFIHDLVNYAITNMKTKRPAFIKAIDAEIDIESIINNGDIEKAIQALQALRLFNINSAMIEAAYKLHGIEKNV